MGVPFKRRIINGFPRVAFTAQSGAGAVRRTGKFKPDCRAVRFGQVAIRGSDC
jgi:hypothetical protein